MDTSAFDKHGQSLGLFITAIEIAKLPLLAKAYLGEKSSLSTVLADLGAALWARVRGRSREWYSVE